jgi:hypothetical protein
VAKKTACKLLLKLIAALTTSTFLYFNIFSLALTAISLAAFF